MTQTGRGQARRTPSRERILDAAYEVARDEGATGLTLDAVAARAGVSKGGLLYHFPSKEALVSAMVEGLCDAFVDSAAAAAHSDPEPVGRSARAYLAAAAGELGHSSRWAGLIGALALYPELVETWRAGVVVGQEADAADGVDPAAATIVRLAADGLWLWSVLGLPAPEADRKADVLAMLDGLTRRTR